MELPALPSTPGTVWDEGRWVWWRLPLELVPGPSGGEERRRVAISVNGISIGEAGRRPRERFVPWSQVVEVREAADPDLAEIRLRDGDTVVLDRWHLPRRDPGAVEKVLRVGLLRAAHERWLGDQPPGEAEDQPRV